MALISSLPVDTHVHFYPGFSIERCLTSAASHMAAVPGSDKRGVLCLVENAGLNVFDTLTGRYGGWTVSETPEAVVRQALRADGTRLLLVAGRQTVTSEALEVLLIGFRGMIPNGLPLAEVIERGLEAEALVVLPWGVGKWTGARGARIDWCIEQGAPRTSVFLADNGVRPALMPRPTRLARAEALGWRVLAGTDPLPLPQGDCDPGRFGIVLGGISAGDLTFRAIAAQLRACAASPETYGQLASGRQFLRRQVAMQIRKRRG